MRRKEAWIAAVGVLVALAVFVPGVLVGSDDEASEPEVPLGLPPVFWPDDNPYTPEKAELGKLLYFDTRLSADGTVSCATCHAPEKGFTDGAGISTGIGGQKGGRSAPTVINRAYSTLQFWDGRAGSLEAQAVGPIANPIEMTSEKDEKAAYDAVVARLKKVPGYVARFKRVFGTEDFTIDHVAKAVATFERTVLSGGAPYDRYLEGDESAMTEAQIRGMNVFFNKTACDSCHIGFNFTDGSYENIGIGMDKPDPDLGRYLVTKREDEKGAFKTPTLREIEHTGPYMHDGRFKTLEEVVEHYDKGGIKNPYLDQRIKPLNLSAQEKKDLVAFLKALSGEGWQHIEAPKTFPIRNRGRGRGVGGRFFSIDDLIRAGSASDPKQWGRGRGVGGRFFSIDDLFRAGSASDPTFTPSRIFSHSTLALVARMRVALLE